MERRSHLDTFEVSISILLLAVQVFILGLARALCMTEFLDTPEPPSSQTQTTAATMTAPSRVAVASGAAYRQTAAVDENDLVTSVVGNRRSSPGATGHLQAAHHHHHSSSSNNNHRTPLPTADATAVGGIGATCRRNYGSSTASESAAAAAAYAASVASRVIQPPHVATVAPRIVDCRGAVATGGVHCLGPPATSSSTAVFDHRHASLVASIERCTDQIPNGRALQTDIREIRRIIKSYVGRLQDREATARNAKEWRIVARVFDRLFFILYICTITVSLATMFPKGE
jgi:hypothetical protein